MTHSLLRSLIRETLLTEEVYGAQAVVYHGTSADPLELVSALLNDEFIPGKGAGSMYGKGLYSVYDLDLSATAGGTYGDHIIKLKVNLYGYIIFDPDIAELVYGSSLTPAQQAEKLGLSKDTITRLQELPSDRPGDLSSKAARLASNFLRGRVKGIVFTGNYDGKVVVSYDPATVIPVAYKEIDDEDWTPVDRSLLRKPQEMKSSPAGERQSAIMRSALGGYRSELHDTDPFTILQRLNRQPPTDRTVKGHFDLGGVGIKTLPAGIKVDGDLNISYTPIEKLPSGAVIRGGLYAVGTRALQSLPADISVGKSIDFTDSGIVDLPAGLDVKGDLVLTGGVVGSLPDGLKVGGDLWIDETRIVSLPADLKVGGSIVGFKGPWAKVPEHLRRKLSA